MNVEPIDDPSEDDLARWHRTMASRLFNRAWEFLDLPELTAAQEEEMVAAAFGSRYHWGQVGTPRQFAIGDWQLARVLVAIGEAELAARFAQRSLELCRDHNLDAFVTGYAHEALARAAAEVNDLGTRDDHLASAVKLAEHIEDEEHRNMLLADLDTINE